MVIPMGIPMGIPVGMGWVWGLKCHPHGSPENNTKILQVIFSVTTKSMNKNPDSITYSCTSDNCKVLNVLRSFPTGVVT